MSKISGVICTRPSEGPLSGLLTTLLDGFELTVAWPAKTIVP